jgi:Fungal Zn(2)-Cys(6) binuclear cluster domain
MVYQGPSRGCATCRKRRIKCDEGRPACNNCLKRKQECPGYRDDFDIMLKDQTTSVPQKAKRKQAAKDKKRAQERRQESAEEEFGPNSSPDLNTSQALTVSAMPVDHEMASLYFFFTNYVATTRDPTVSRGYFEYLLPAYSRVMPSSPLSLATSAVAVNLSQMWMQRGPDTLLARSIFQKALTSLKDDISDPVKAMTDETLLTVLLLEFYEAVGSRFQNKDSSATHQSGAVALIKHRGAANFKSEVGKRLLIAVRSQVITHAVQTKKKIDFDPDIWDDQDEMPINPAINLDKLVAGLANLQVQESSSFSRSASPTTPASISSFSTTSPSSSIQSLFNAAVELDSRLSVWPTQVPDNWHPVAVSSPELVHSSIFEAGVYGDSCDVYYSLHVTVLYNQYRCARLAVLKIILKCCSIMGNQFMGGFRSTQEHARREIQALVDEICASAPFYLGNRTKAGLIDDTDGIYYPQMPIMKNEFADKDPEFFEHALDMARRRHSRLAAALGGHFLISTLLAVIRTVQDPDLIAANEAPILRKGQVKWILQQFDRIRAIYCIPKPARALISPELSSTQGKHDSDDEDVEIIPRTYAGNRNLFEQEAWMTAIRGKHPSRPLT